MNEPLHITLSGEEVPVRVRRSAQAKRMILRICDVSREVKLTLPKRASLRAARKFMEKHTGWLEDARAALPRAPTLMDGTMFSFRGVPHRLVFTGESPRKVTREGGTITIGGPRDMAPKRLMSWLKSEARAQLKRCADHHAEMLGVSFDRLAVGDMRSRWGSCSSAGTLKFNWRLIMTADEVLDYVAAHEVAHLREMNHSPRFWAHVEKLRPDYRAQRKRLKGAEGQALMAVRFE
ncbi:M48 family metallopeptidase [Kordiimonas sp.]|uniref:M48 family metallopeptidase n=1 Tax=Kordiimonas sp. TaxID=1970157 RepID=UPI003A92748B